jgi:predicted HTH domain antitoxin
MTSHAPSTQSDTVAITVELPRQALEFLGLTPDETAMYLRKLALIELFRRGEVSSGWAAERLGMSKSDFIDLLAQHEVPYFNLTAEELRQDVEAARSYIAPGTPPPSPTADR